MVTGIQTLMTELNPTERKTMQRAQVNYTTEINCERLNKLSDRTGKVDLTTYRQKCGTVWEELE